MEIPHLKSTLNPKTVLVLTTSFTPPTALDKTVFSPNANLLICSDVEGSLYVWDLQRKELLRTLISDRGYIRSLVLSPDSKELMSISSQGPKAYLWNIDVGEEDGQMTAEQAAVARLEFKDSMRDNMDAFQELLPDGTRSQSQSFIEGIIAGDTSMIISAVKNAVMAGVEQEGRGEEPRNLKVEGSGSGQMGKGNQKPARSLSEAQQRMSNMFGPMR